jgi:hypothetical protein
MREQPFVFSSLRADWYHSNQSLPRAIRQAADGIRLYTFLGFPRQWSPLFEWFGVRYNNCINPAEYLPFFSDLSSSRLKVVLKKATDERMLRSLVEVAAVIDPVVADCLYILDHSVKNLSSPMRLSMSADGAQTRKSIILNGWHSYGQIAVLHLEREVAKVAARGEGAVILPCSFKRPYSSSPTHKQIYPILEKAGYDDSQLHKIVITSLGVIPQELWESPAVLKYDAGVPDLYRILRLIREYFSVRKYSYVLDCSQFPPYSDLLGIAQREGFIKTLRRINVPKRRAFYLRHPKTRVHQNSRNSLL